jgi:hypothetical protein
MTFSVALLVYVAFTAAAGFGLASTALKTPLPQKWVWLVGFGVLAANALCNALYQHGGAFAALLPALYPLMVLLHRSSLAMYMKACCKLSADMSLIVCHLCTYIHCVCVVSGRTGDHCHAGAGGGCIQLHQQGLHLVSLVLTAHW